MYFLYTFASLFCLFLAPSSPPSNLTLIEKGSSYVLLQWQPPPEQSQNGLIRYYIVALLEGNSSEITKNHTSSYSQPSINIGSLQPGVTYTCVVSAVTVSAGPFSEPISFTTEPSGKAKILYNYMSVNFTSFLVPGTVQSLVAVAVSSRSMNISWKLPDNLNTAKQIIEFQIHVNHFGGGSDDDEGYHTTTLSKYVVVGSLHPNYVYQCSVTFRTNAGLGPLAYVLLKLPPDSEHVIMCFGLKGIVL